MGEKLVALEKESSGHDGTFSGGKFCSGFLSLDIIDILRQRVFLKGTVLHSENH